MKDLKTDDLVDITIRGARLIYTIKDHSADAQTLTTVMYGGTRYVLLTRPGDVTITKIEDDALTETTTAAAEPVADHGPVPAERVAEILAVLDGFVVHEYEGGTELVNGVAAAKASIVGSDFNLDKAVAWAKEQPDVSAACGPLLGEANVQLVDGTVIEWQPDEKSWAVTVSDECDTAGVV